MDHYSSTDIDSGSATGTDNDNEGGNDIGTDTTGTDNETEIDTDNDADTGTAKYIDTDAIGTPYWVSPILYASNIYVYCYHLFRFRLPSFLRSLWSDFIEPVITFVQ